MPQHVNVNRKRYACINASTLYHPGDAHSAERLAALLFGEDVQKYLETLRRCFAWLLSMTNEVIDKDPKRVELIDTKSKYIAEIIAFYEVAPKLFAPYMKLTHENTPFWRPWSQPTTQSFLPHPSSAASPLIAALALLRNRRA
jgi:hypothetical protein